MVKLKAPLLALGALGRLTKAITFTRRRKQDIAEKTPTLLDIQSPAQLAWRHMYQKCALLWHALSAVEKEDWESLARSRHMTGFAYWQSQCLRPNPGIYLPLQGGTMAGDIDMAKYRILKLPLPTNAQEAASKAYVDAGVASATYTEGARAYHNVDQAIPNNTLTVLAFNSEDFDTDAIHDFVVNNSRLTCKTAGTYLLYVNIEWQAAPAGYRRLFINHSVDGIMAWLQYDVAEGANPYGQCLMTCYPLSVTDWMTCHVKQNSGGAINIEGDGADIRPRFGIQRIG